MQIKKLDQKTLTARLRDASRDIGPIAKYFEPPFALMLVDHDTGCQIALSLKSKGHGELRVWTGSIWYSSAYSFNDRDKQLGWNHDAYFAHDKACEYFEKILKEHSALLSKPATAKVRLDAQREVNRRGDIDYYRALLNG